MKSLSELDRNELIEKISELEKKLKEKSSQTEESRAKSHTSSLFEFSEKGLRLKLYRQLLKKYAGLINEKEKRTIGEVKSLVNAEDLTIQSIAAEFKPENYSFEKDYLKAAEKAFEFSKKEIRYTKADIDIDYFLSPVEIVTEKVADDQDQAVFLCSLLDALGDKSASVVIAELENPESHAFVLMEHGDKAFFLDPTQDHTFDEFSGNMKEVMAEYSFKSSKIRRLLYKFNTTEYKSFIEEE